MIFISTYSNNNVGLAQELMRYLKRRKESFFILYHPLNLTGRLCSHLEEYRDGEKVNTVDSMPSIRIAFLHYFRCFLTTFNSLLFRAKQVNLFIGFSNVDAIAAIVIRLFSPMKVVYVSTDFSPKRRFENALLNWLYYTADKIAYRWSTAVWHMYPERGQLKEYKYRTRSFDVLDGNSFRRIQRLPIEQINRFRLVYIGQINRECRLDEAIKTVSLLRNEYPCVYLDIISSGNPEYEKSLRDLVKEEGVADRVVFHGQISDPEVYEKLLCQCGIGLSLYELDENDHAWYGTPLKVYLYAACGLPSICSDRMGPYTRESLETDGIGVMAARGKLLEVVRSLFEGQDRYVEMRKRAIQWASQYDYEDKFDKFLSLV